jgi:hypothetical protein
MKTWGMTNNKQKETRTCTECNSRMRNRRWLGHYELYLLANTRDCRQEMDDFHICKETGRGQQQAKAVAEMQS